MKHSYFTVLFSALALFLINNVNAETVTEATVGGGYQNNLFNDSSSISDQYGLFAVNLNYYPSGSIQISGAAQHQAYATNSDLSNTKVAASILYIPTRESSALMLALGGNLSVRKFGAVFDLYDQTGSSLSAEARYRVAQSVFFRSSVSYLNNDYSNSDYGSNRSVDLSTGLNITLFGSNSVALRLDYTHRSFDQISLIQNGNGNMQLQSQTSPETFNATGLSARISRPLGTRTGLNISAGYRRLHVDNDFAVMGYTIDYLSPWAELWEGASFSGSLKHFFPSQLIAEFAAAYYDKEFVDVIEYSEDAGEEYWFGGRIDRLTTLSLNISRPVSLKNGKSLTPSTHIGYRANRSTVEFFDYEGLEASLALRISI